MARHQRLPLNRKQSRFNHKTFFYYSCIIRRELLIDLFAEKQKKLKEMKNFVKNSLLGIMMITVVLSLLSCNEEKTEEGQMVKTSSVISHNPFDYVGREHNLELQNIINNVDINSFSYSSIYEYNIRNYSWDINEVSLYSYKTYMNNVLDVTFLYLEDSSIVNSLITDREVVYYLNRFRNVFVNILNSGRLISADSLSNRIIQIEDEFIQTHDMSNLTNKQKDLLICFSIGRYSYAYWIDAIHNSENRWYPLWNDLIGSLSDIDTNRQDCKFAKKLISRLRDVAAVVCGAIADAVTYVVEASVPNEDPNATSVSVRVNDKTAGDKAAEKSAVVRENIKGDSE